MAEEFWGSLSTIKKSIKCHQLKGNHDERGYKRIAEKAPEFNGLVRDSIDKLFKFKRVLTQDEQREELILGDILFMHGFRSQLGTHSKHNRMCTVVGHSHVGGVVYHRNGLDTLWELNCGLSGGDESSVCMSYTHQRRISTWTQGFGFIDEYGPRFIPLENS